MFFHLVPRAGLFGTTSGNFNPLHERSRSRWISVATALRTNIPLPAIELVQAGEAYYVQDGHHRISVAKAMDQQVIEARIVN